MTKREVRKYDDEEQKKGKGIMKSGKVSYEVLWMFPTTHLSTLF